MQEFYEQGDLEKHLGLEPLPFMIRDTHKTAYSNNQKVGSPRRPPGGHLRREWAHPSRQLHRGRACSACLRRQKPEQMTPPL